MVDRPQVVVFDVIDTLFRIDALAVPLVACGMDPLDARTLYASMLRDAMTSAVTGGYAPLPDILGGALDQLRANRGMRPNHELRTAVVEAMGMLEPHRDAADCFRSLKEAGFRVHALSNGGMAATQALIERAGMADVFDGIHSVEAARRYKPHRSAYMAAVEKMDAEPGAVMLVATHPWDCHGAKRAGLRAGFVRRGQDWPDYFVRPDVTGDELLDVARAIIAD